MNSDYPAIAVHLLGALAAGGIIGLERSYHGRPAGFRTHALVCLASSVLMLVSFYEWKWLPGMPPDAVRTDPTRVAQGIMTGIGFLGAGVIFKEGLSIRGLTTAASIWITATIGILFGVGFYFPAVLATVLTLGVLSLFQLIEARMPNFSYAYHYIRFDRDKVAPEAEVRKLLIDQGFSISNMGYRVIPGGTFEYRMIIRTRDLGNASRLAETLRGLEAVREFGLGSTEE